MVDPSNSTLHRPLPGGHRALTYLRFPLALQASSVFVNISMFFDIPNLSITDPQGIFSFVRYLSRIGGSMVFIVRIPTPTSLQPESHMISPI